MSLFSSPRERRLWLMALAVVVAIYATLAITPKLVGQVNDGILAAAFLGCLILVGVAVLTQGLSIRPSGWEIGVAVGVAVVYLLLSVRMALPERSHLMEYGVLAVLVYEAISERVSQGRYVSYPALSATLITSLIGVVDECIQIVIPNRVFDWRDIVFNVLAVLTAIVGMVVLRWVRARNNPIRNGVDDGNQ